MHTEIKSIQDEMKSQLDGLKKIKTSYDDTYILGWSEKNFFFEIEKVPPPESRVFTLKNHL